MAVVIPVLFQYWNINLYKGSSITLECSAHPASPSPNESKIRWLIDGKEVKFDDETGDARINNAGSGLIGGADKIGANYVHMIKHDQQSWTVRSNLTLVINRKEPNIRNVACIGK